MTGPDMPVLGDSGVAASLSQILIKQGEASTQLAVISEQLKQVSTGVNDHEGRLRLLEAAKAKIYGAAITVSVVTSAAGSVIGYFLGRGH
jgi:hypothetical protein